MEKFRKQILKTIREHQLFTKQDNLLVALSGGSDSVALLRVLLELGYHCQAAHCNFHLRDAESDRDEKFVRTLCSELEVPLFVTNFDTRAYATTHKISIEMAARDLRYAYFEEIRKQLNLSAIVVAHHRDDNVETFLLNLMRGSGLHGLTGMHFRNGFVVRPLLEVSRKDILEYLKTLAQAYVTDSSNLETQFTRNKIRLQLLPLMRQINPSVDATIEQTSMRLLSIEKVCQGVLSETKKRVLKPASKDILLVIDVAAILQEPSPEWILYELLSPFGFSSTQINDILCTMDTHTGARFQSNRTDLLIDRGLIEVKKRENLPDVEERAFNMACRVKVKGGFLRNFILSADELKHIPHEKHVAALDASAIIFPLIVRRIKRGDRFIPFGMKGSKLVSDYLTDRKYSLFQKQEQLAVCSGKDIIWLVNERPDNRFAIVPGKTEKILWIEFEPEIPSTTNI
jgi:tRNA(Ile)-lysidine synthase